MILPEIKEQILSDLERLAPEQQQRVAELVHGMLPSGPRGVSGKALMHFAGTLSDASAREMMAAIEEGCSQVDSDEW